MQGECRDAVPDVSGASQYGSETGVVVWPDVARIREHREPRIALRAQPDLVEWVSGAFSRVFAVAGGVDQERSAGDVGPGGEHANLGGLGPGHHDAAAGAVDEGEHARWLRVTALDENGVAQTLPWL